MEKSWLKKKKNKELIELVYNKVDFYKNNYNHLRLEIELWASYGLEISRVFLTFLNFPRKIFYTIDIFDDVSTFKKNDSIFLAKRLDFHENYKITKFNIFSANEDVTFLL